MCWTPTARRAAPGTTPAGPATGSAAGPAAGYLLHHGIRPAGEPIMVYQGRFTGRPSTIEVRPGPDGRLWVGGPVAPVAAGRFQAHLT
jgi:trans-2,3-dihydro-3-hydroxyanthranilate isomerase